MPHRAVSARPGGDEHTIPVKSNGEVYFNVTVYREPGSGTWTAEPMSPANPEDEGHMVDLFYNSGTGDTPGEALEQLAVEPLTDEAIEQIKGAEEVAAVE